MKPGGAGPPASPAEREAWNRRRRAAARWKPARVRLLVLGLAPPDDPGAYFYFEEPANVDPLFANLSRVLFEEDDEPAEKGERLKQLKRRGVYVIELKPSGPWTAEDRPADYAPWLLLAAEPLQPERVVAADPLVLEAVRASFTAAHVPLIEDRVPAPGQDPEGFRRELRALLVRHDLEALIRPLPPAKKPAARRGGDVARGGAAPAASPPVEPEADAPSTPGPARRPAAKRGRRSS